MKLKVIECADSVQKKEIIKGMNFIYNIATSQVTLDTINKYKETYQNWYSRLNLRFSKTEKNATVY